MRRFAFSIIVTALVVFISVGIAVAARNNKWWWDNLHGADSSNFVPSDQINKANVSQLEVA
jgi:hypothetical protein